MNKIPYTVSTQLINALLVGADKTLAASDANAQSLQRFIDKYETRLSLLKEEILVEMCLMKKEFFVEDGDERKR